MVKKTIHEKVPVQVTKKVQTAVCEKVPVTVTRNVQKQAVEKVPDASRPQREGERGRSRAGHGAGTPAGPTLTPPRSTPQPRASEGRGSCRRWAPLPWRTLQRLDLRHPRRGPGCSSKGCKALRTVTVNVSRTVQVIEIRRVPQQVTKCGRTRSSAWCPRRSTTKAGSRDQVAPYTVTKQVPYTLQGPVPHTTTEMVACTVTKRVPTQVTPRRRKEEAAVSSDQATIRVATGVFWV